MKKVKVNKTNANKVNTKIELTTMQLYDDISVTTEIETLSEMESWAYDTEEELSMAIFDASRAYEDGKTDNIVLYTEAELTDTIIRAGLVVNLFDDEDNDYGFNTHALSLAIIKKCTMLIGVLHGNYDCLKIR
jgi:hypothetical protein